MAWPAQSTLRAIPAAELSQALPGFLCSDSSGLTPLLFLPRSLTREFLSAGAPVSHHGSALCSYRLGMFIK